MWKLLFLIIFHITIIISIILKSNFTKEREYEHMYPYNIKFAAISLKNLCNIAACNVATILQQCCCNFCVTLCCRDMDIFHIWFYMLCMFIRIYSSWKIFYNNHYFLYTSAMSIIIKLIIFYQLFLLLCICVHVHNYI